MQFADSAGNIAVGALIQTYIFSFVCKRGLDTACKIGKIRKSKRVLHAVIKTFLHLAKGCLIAFRAIAKG
jgi:hypothetical protein